MKRIRGETFYHELLRRASFYIVKKYLIKTDITPNRITLFRNILFIISLFFFIRLDSWYIFAFFLFQISELLDSVDGDLARYKGLKSKKGVWLEIFFDSILTPVWGVLGMVFAYIGYKIDGTYLYFFIWGAIAFSANLEKNFYIHFKGVKEALSEAEHSHIYFGFVGEDFKTKVRNFIIVSKSWENQWLVFAGLIYTIFGINIFLYIWIWLLALNQIHWIRLAWDGYRKSI